MPRQGRFRCHDDATAASTLRPSAFPLSANWRRSSSDNFVVLGSEVVDHGLLLPYPRPRDEPLRYRAEVMAPGEDFDQTGFELPPAPKAPAEATGQGQLFDDDCSRPDSADGEPVFWTGGAEESGPAEDFVQADALESV